MKNKTSSGKDGLSQEHLILGTEELLNPLTDIVNYSIKTGVFPRDWKEAQVTSLVNQ